MNVTNRILLTAVFGVGLAACGGGSSGGNTLQTTDLATVTSANAPVIAGAVMTAALEGGDLGGFAGLSGGAPLAYGPAATGVVAKLGAASAGKTQTMLEQSQIGTFQVPVGPATTACPVGGTVTISGDVAGTETLSAGDTITFEYAGCDDGLSVVDGTFALTVTRFAGDFVGGAFSFGVRVELTDFEVVEDGEAATANGEITVGLDTTSSPSIAISVGASSLTLATAAGTHTLSAYSLIQTLDGVTGAYTLDASGSLTGSAFEGRVDFATSVDLQSMGSGFAFAGELVITGAAGATIRIVVLDGTMVRLEVDEDGDGTVDEFIDTSWAALT